MNISQSECVFVALGMLHTIRVHHIVICDLLRSTTFFHIISYTVRFSKNLIEHKICFGFLYTICPKHFLILNRTE